MSVGYYLDLLTRPLNIKAYLLPLPADDLIGIKIAALQITVEIDRA